MDSQNTHVPLALHPHISHAHHTSHILHTSCAPRTSYLSHLVPLIPLTPHTLTPVPLIPLTPHTLHSHLVPLVLFIPLILFYHSHSFSYWKIIGCPLTPFQSLNSIQLFFYKLGLLIIILHISAKGFLLPCPQVYFTPNEWAHLKRASN